MLNCTKWSLAALIFVAAPPAINAQCAGYYQWPRWLWQDLQYTTTSSVSTADIDAAAAGWGAVQSDFTIAVSDPYDDIEISDNNSLGENVVAQTTPYSQSSDPGCYNQLTECGFCLNASVMFYATVELNTSVFSGLVTQYHSTGVTYDEVVEQALSHEFGHVLRLADLNLDYGQEDCNATSVMLPAATNIQCDIDFAQQCDGSTMYSAYGGWNFESFYACPGPCDGGSCT